MEDVVTAVFWSNLIIGFLIIVLIATAIAALAKWIVYKNRYEDRLIDSKVVLLTRVFGKKGIDIDEEMKKIDMKKKKFYEEEIERMMIEELNQKKQ